MEKSATSEMLDGFLKTLTKAELEFIAARDYGIDADVHLTELNKLVSTQNGSLTEGQHWHPYEVIELGAHTLVRGHEREFTACTLLVLRAVASGFDTSTSLEVKLEDRAADYRALPAPLGNVILRAYELAGFPVANPT